MRIGGLASGIDTDELINKLMTAERIPLDKMQQDSQKLTWKRDAFREVNKALNDLKDMIFQMTLPSKYTTKKVSSSQEGAVTATGGSSSVDGTYNIKVTKLATSAMIVGKTEINPDEPLGNLLPGNKISFATYKKDGTKQEHQIDVSETDTLNDVLGKITKADNNVRAFYDKNSKQVVMETTRTGDYNPGGNEIVFEGEGSEFFRDTLNFSSAVESGGTDAVFFYNEGLELTSHDNNYVLNGVAFEFQNITNGSATLTVTNDTDEAFDNIMKFVEKYNEIIEKLNNTQQEDRNRKFPPLTDAQKKDMTENQIKVWEEKAKSGMLKGEASITNVLTSMRGSLYEKVNTGGKFESLYEIGLGTTKDYRDGGKIAFTDESGKKLREMLEKDPEAIKEFFIGSDQKTSGKEGLLEKLKKNVNTTFNQIEERAGKLAGSALDNYTLGKQMKDLDSRISNFERRLAQVETRYWNQFNAMEKAISRLNSQSSQLLSQFGG